LEKAVCQCPQPSLYIFTKSTKPSYNLNISVATIQEIKESKQHDYLATGAWGDKQTFLLFASNSVELLIPEFLSCV
jgi:hypothetical protein